MYKVTKQKFYLFITFILVLFNTYELFVVEGSGNYINKFRYCFLIVLILSRIKFRTIQKKGDFTFSGLFSMLRYVCALCFIFDGYLRYKNMSGAMQNFGIKTMILGAIIFLLQRGISKARYRKVWVQNESEKNS